MISLKSSRDMEAQYSKKSVQRKIEKAPNGVSTGSGSDRVRANNCLK